MESTYTIEIILATVIMFFVVPVSFAIMFYKCKSIDLKEFESIKNFIYTYCAEISFTNAY